MSKFDFGAMAIDTEATRKMPIIYPGDTDPMVDEAGQQAFIEFLPWDSQAGRELDRLNYVSNVRKGFRQKSAADLRKEAEEDDPIEEVVRRLVALSVGWHLVGPDRNVIAVPYSKEAAAEFFASSSMAWLRRRAFAFVSNEGNFMQGSSKA